MSSNHLLATALLLLSLFREAASKVPSAPYSLQGSPLFTPGQGGGGHRVFLQLTWDSEYEMPDSTVVAEYMVYYRAVSEVGSSPVRSTPMIRAFGADAMLSTEMGLTYEAWVTSVAMTGEESQPSISVTIDMDYLQSVATAHLPDGIHFTCTFAQVYFATDWLFDHPQNSFRK